MDIVCYADISKTASFEDIIQRFHKNRVEYLNSISFLPRKKQSALVWLLLEKALLKINLDIKDFDFVVTKEGKWFEKNNSFNFSLSHSGNIVCVAISIYNPISIDVEECSDKLLGVEKLLLDKNFDGKENKIKFLARKWTERECLIKEKKAKFTKSFHIKDILDKDYCISIASSVLNVDGIEIIKIKID